jgi:hypothetical protein
VGDGLVHKVVKQTQKLSARTSFVWVGSSSTLLGFEAAALRRHLLVWGCCAGPHRDGCLVLFGVRWLSVVVGVVVAPSWWWGVVFDLWIVVASI